MDYKKDIFEDIQTIVHDLDDTNLYDCQMYRKIIKEVTYKSPVLISSDNTIKAYLSATLIRHHTSKPEGGCFWSNEEYNSMDNPKLIIQTKNKTHNIGLNMDERSWHFLIPVSFSPDSQYLLFDKIAYSQELDSNFVIFSLKEKEGFSIPFICPYFDFLGFISPNEVVFECPLIGYYIFNLDTKKLTSQTKPKTNDFKSYGFVEGNYEVIEKKSVNIPY